MHSAKAKSKLIFSNEAAPFKKVHDDDGDEIAYSDDDRIDGITDSYVGAEWGSFKGDLNDSFKKASQIESAEVM